MWACKFNLGGGRERPEGGGELSESAESEMQYDLSSRGQGASGRQNTTESALAMGGGGRRSSPRRIAQG